MKYTLDTPTEDISQENFIISKDMIISFERASIGIASPEVQKYKKQCASAILYLALVNVRNANKEAALTLYDAALYLLGDIEMDDSTSWDAIKRDVQSIINENNAVQLVKTEVAEIKNKIDLSDQLITERLLSAKEGRQELQQTIDAMRAEISEIFGMKNLLRMFAIIIGAFSLIALALAVIVIISISFIK